MPEIHAYAIYVIFGAVILCIACNLIDMTLAAMLGLCSLTLLGIVGQKDVLNAVLASQGSLSLLFGGMVVARVLLPTGIFENIGTRIEPRYAEGKYLTQAGKVIQMDLCMMVAVAMDWDRDGDVDLIVGQEDGRVALMEHTGQMIEGMPQFLPPRFFQQQADDLKFGALATPFSFDWDGDGDEDLICGNTAGYIGFIENLDGGNPPQHLPFAFNDKEIGFGMLIEWVSLTVKNGLHLAS